VLWAEPKGANGEGSASSSGTESLTVRKGAMGEETFAKVRRFIVVKPMEGHCICLSVSPVLDELENSICSILLQAYPDIQWARCEQERCACWSSRHHL
jgi:hypothetical protein